MANISNDDGENNVSDTSPRRRRRPQHHQPPPVPSHAHAPSLPPGPSPSAAVRLLRLGPLLSVILTPCVSLLALHVFFFPSFFLAKRSVPHTSPCTPGRAASDLLESALGLTQGETSTLRRRGVLSSSSPAATTAGDAGVDRTGVGNDGDDAGGTMTSEGCWMDRRVDAVAFVVVDALRFDFAASHLPKSVGSRMGNGTGTGTGSGTDGTGRSQLYRFVADPPTVTMQRLKGLTTGGLPTFADISGSFGGADVDEDSWIDQLRKVSPSRRGYAIRDGTGDESLSGSPRMAFVGDDTWVDLFPDMFDDAHPYPSFNTRDLDTVDDGCLEHLPRLLRSLGPSKGGRNDKDKHHDFFELMVVHFLGVDHVGHTYGPNEEHMVQKLNQMDEALSTILDAVDAGRDGDGDGGGCRVAFVLGDHGMTDDGNHGGGTEGEVNAALFAHYSPGCGDMSAGLKITGVEVGQRSEEAFRSIHQIDLVPTISVLMGLPIPFANIGGVVPALLPPPPTSRLGDGGGPTPAPEEIAAAALALNAAQVWTYLSTYSGTGTGSGGGGASLPSDSMADLRRILVDATASYRMAIASHHDGGDTAVGGGGDDDGDALAYREACGLYKLFLTDATALGRRVWTTFDVRGMVTGIVLLLLVALMELAVLLFHTSTGASPRHGRKEWEEDGGVIVEKDAVDDSSSRGTAGGLSMGSGDEFVRRNLAVEVPVTVVLILFHCVALTFSNSYIISEQSILMFSLAVLCVLLSYRRCLVVLWLGQEPKKKQRQNGTVVTSSHGESDIRTPRYGMSSMYGTVWLLLVIPLCGRANELFVSGHGADPSIRQHVTHYAIVFCSSLLLLAVIRTRMMKAFGDPRSKWHVDSACDYAALICLALGWCEKRTVDPKRNGYFFVRSSLIFTLLGTFSDLWVLVRLKRRPLTQQSSELRRSLVTRTISLMSKLFVMIMAVTGPSSGSSTVLVVLQIWALLAVMKSRGILEVHDSILAALWRFSIRHAFFATGHACSFNRLHFSAAFVATDVFYFYPAGVSLFLNTFGWEIAGLISVVISSVGTRRERVWRWFCVFQLLEILGSCVSVSLLRRHLMVWAIFAPRFAFAAVFFTLTMIGWLVGLLLGRHRYVLGIAPIDK